MWALRLLLLLVVVAGLAGCASLDSEPNSRGSVLESGVFGDLRARKPKATSNEPQGLIPVGGGADGETRIYGPGGYAEGDAGTGGGTAGAAVATEPGAYRLNFENAEIRDVIHAVLGEALQLNYTMSPDVAGTTTISSARPVSRDELLSTLEVVLASQGFSLTKAGGVYRVGPLIPSAGTVNTGARSTPGYGVSIVPLRFVSVRAITRLLGGFVTDAESLRIDSTRNALVISGPGPKRAEVVETVLSFDADFMADQSVAILELRRASPETVVSELERLFDAGASGNAAGVIEFKAIKRLRAVLAISKNPTLIRRAETWVRRLDEESTAAGGNVYVYRARYRDAKELARIVGSLFNVSADTGGTTEPGTAGGTNGGTAGGDTGNPEGGDGAGGGGGDFGNTGMPGEQPIDNITGAGEDPNADPNAGGGTAFSQTPSPDLIDLTSQPGAGGGGNQGIRISADPTNNSVVIYTDADTYRKILATLKELDSAPLQVAIQATIAEVRLTNDLEYGVQYFLKNNEGSISFQDVAGNALARSVPGFNFLLGSSSDPDLIVSALDKITDVEILSSPSLVVMENQTANLQVGDDVPVKVAETTRTDNANDPGITTNEIEYRNTGIILKVTPRIGENGAVTMTIEQEISSVAQNSSLGPVFSKRKFSSRVSVIDGQTVVLAGLISTGKDNTRQGLPVLNRIPIIRDVAGTTEKGGNRTELVVLIKPVIIHDGDDAQSVAEDLRSRMWAIGQRERQAP
jgi:general secretion pathway protein D